MADVTQADIDRNRHERARMEVEDRKLETLEDAKRFAESWIVIGMQHAANEEFYRERSVQAMSELLQIRELLCVPGTVECTTFEDVHNKALQAVRAKVAESEKWAAEVGRLRTIIAESISFLNSV